MLIYNFFHINMCLMLNRSKVSLKKAKDDTKCNDFHSFLGNASGRNYGMSYLQYLKI